LENFLDECAESIMVKLSKIGQDQSRAVYMLMTDHARLRLRGENRIRFQQRDSRIPFEVPDIECQKMRDAVPLHSSDQPGIMCVFALNLVNKYQSLPTFEYPAIIADRRKKALQSFEFGLCLRDGKPQAIVCYRSSRNRLKLVQHLRNRPQIMTFLQQPFGCRDSHGMHCVTRLSTPTQYVGVEQDLHRPRSP
jgi:hypothetical protein